MSLDWLGIPEGYICSNLAYEPTANLVVAELQSRSLGKAFLPTRLFARRVDENDYAPVVKWESNLSTESVIFAQDGVLAAFNSTRYTSIEEDHLGAHWNGVFLWRLDSGQVSSCVDGASLGVPEGFSRGWVTKLMGFSINRKLLYVQVGLQNAPTDFGVQYYIATLDLDTRAIATITELRGTFY
ncbi:MAG TPA: hypothetical protein VFI95_20650 [Terriglobales bacterium]|nr:hypothetical protein [Terriglobales bacterium]